MIKAEDVHDWVRQVPFEPFQIVTSSGEKYEIRHPDACYVTKRVVYVGLYRERRPKVPDSVAHVSVLHITELVPLPTETANA